MANFAELCAKMSYLRYIYGGERTWWTIFLVYAIGNVARGGFDAFYKLEKFVRSRKLIWDPKRANFGELWAKFVHLDFVEPQNIFFCNLKSLKSATDHISHDIN